MNATPQHQTPEHAPGSGRPVAPNPQSAIDTANSIPSPISKTHLSPRSPAHFATVSSTYFTYLTGLFIAVMIISNITVTQPVVIGPIKSDGAFYLFPLAYVVGDVLSEVYGFRATRRIIILGFCILLLMSACFYITGVLPHGPHHDPRPWQQVAGVVPRFVAAGLAGYLVGEFMNSFVLVKMKQATGERWLWSRLLGSTLVGEFFDTLVFCAIAAGALGFNTPTAFVNYAGAGFVWKVLVEIAVMPVTYLVCNFVKKREPSYLAD